MQPSLAIVVPCYNEEEVLAETTKQLSIMLERAIRDQLVCSNSKIYYVDDGSSDQTWPLIQTLASENNFVHGIKLSRNRGHQNALLAGLLGTSEDITVSIDADLQDDPNVILKMLSEYHQGNQIVYGVRDSRDTDTRFKRMTAEGYYKFLAKLGVELVYNHADFRLMSRVAVNALAQYNEVNLFLRGMIPQLGYQSSCVFYARAERLAGESKYPLRKMLKLAWQGVTSFSNQPIRWITKMGFAVSGVATFIALWALYIAIATDSSVPGWTSTVVPLVLLSGVQLVSLGVLGEYLGKIYMEVKNRPRFHIENSTYKDDTKKMTLKAKDYSQ